MHTSIHTYIHTYTHAYIHTYIRTYIHPCIHPYIHTYIHTYMHACIHTQAWGVTSSNPVTFPLLLLRLKEAEEARTLCIAIEGLEMAGELVQALQTHSTALTTLYRELHQLTTNEVNDINQYSKLFDQATQYQTWFKSRKRLPTPWNLLLRGEIIPV